MAGFRWFQLVSGGFRWFQLVSGGFWQFQLVPRFSKYENKVSASFFFLLLGTFMKEK